MDNRRGSDVYIRNWNKLKPRRYSSNTTRSSMRIRLLLYFLCVYCVSQLGSHSAMITYVMKKYNDLLTPTDYIRLSSQSCMPTIN
ncbi:hypothetical protein RhiirA4_474738 [Rhizophagus irregularis]|uniref:Uncharacterized protein n=1 Tax=Rhizophagus irregularis TaxID=588596 RepID=A0A2I1H915_9GLOM|nr:hypothetical protein RhiirA4_474738 [Rhizophagus irregularis]